MTATPMPDLAALPSDLPTVERAPVVPAGFLVGGTTAGIKASGRPDLAMIRVVDGPAPVAGVFTRNAFAAAPVRLCRRHLLATNPGGDGRSGWTWGLVSTSGSANAATGEAGDRDQARIAGWLATALGPGIAPEQTLGFSTGLIGTRLPLDKVEAGIATLAGRLAADGPALAGTAEAFRTTDSRAKIATTTVTLPGPDGSPVTVRVSGIAKGVGMIHPRMATMLAYLLTDATIDAPSLHAMLRDRKSTRLNSSH